MPVAGEAQRWLNYLHVDDAASALLLLSARGQGLYHLVGESWRKGEILDSLAAWTGKSLAQARRDPSRRGASHYRLCSDRMPQLAWQAKHKLQDLLLTP